MASEAISHLKALHTSAIDARNGYQEALKDSAGSAMTPVFHEMTRLHDDHAAELARELVKANELPDDAGSFMTTIHKTIMDVRSIFNGLDESVLPGLIDGEKRNLSKYDEALKLANVPANITALLNQQRHALAQKITYMQAQEAKSERVS